MMKFKLIISNPFIFAEKKSVERLKELANEGWQVKKLMFGGLVYLLEKVEPAQITYCFDSQPNPNELYYRIYETNGWEIVDSSNSLHLFRAKEGTPPIITDSETLIRRFRNEIKFFGKYSLILFIFLFCAFLGWVFIEWSIVRNILVGILSILFIGLMVTFVPYVMYKWRIQNLLKEDKNE